MRTICVVALLAWGCDSGSSDDEGGEAEQLSGALSQSGAIAEDADGDELFRVTEDAFESLAPGADIQTPAGRRAVYLGLRAKLRAAKYPVRFATVLVKGGTRHTYNSTYQRIVDMPECGPASDDCGCKQAIDLDPPACGEGQREENSTTGTVRSAIVKCCSGTWEALMYGIGTMTGANNGSGNLCVPGEDDDVYCDACAGTDNDACPQNNPANQPETTDI